MQPPDDEQKKWAIPPQKIKQRTLFGWEERPHCSHSDFSFVSNVFDVYFFAVFSAFLWIILFSENKRLRNLKRSSTLFQPSAQLFSISSKFANIKKISPPPNFSLIFFDQPLKQRRTSLYREGKMGQEKGRGGWILKKFGVKIEISLSSKIQFFLCSP